MEKPKCLRTEIHGSVATLFLANPETRNAMGPEFWEQLPREIFALDADPAIRCIVLAAEGPAFSVGLNLKTMMPALTEGNENPETLYALIKKYQDAISCVEKIKTPVVAAIHGYCLGGGLDLVTACDIRICAKGALFSVRETRMAIVADLGTLQRLPKIVGEGVAREMALTGDDISADRALATNLVSQVYDTREATLAAAQAMAHRIAAHSPLVIGGIKMVMNYNRDHDLAEGLDYVARHNSEFLFSADLQEAITAFAEKRPPLFKGE